jgi:hypothetical protein
MTFSTPTPSESAVSLNLTIDPKNIPLIPYQLIHYLPLKRLSEIKWSPSTTLLPSFSGRLEIIEYLSSGRLWDAYQGKILGKNGIASSVIIKVCCPGNMTGSTYINGYTHYTYNTEEALRAIAEEMKILKGPLKPLQGVLVPELLGHWTGEISGDVYHIVIMEDCGEE